MILEETEHFLKDRPVRYRSEPFGPEFARSKGPTIIWPGDQAPEKDSLVKCQLRTRLLD